MEREHDGPFGPDEDELREAVAAGLVSEREAPLLEAAAVERALRRELDALCDRDEARRARQRRGAAGGLR